MGGRPVDVDNLVQAETARMFTALQQRSGGVNVWSHSRAPTPVEEQPVIRMNRDTLYSSAVVDISDGATVTIAARILVGPAGPDDVAEVNALQDRLGLAAGSDSPFLPPDYDVGTLDAHRTALPELARHVQGFSSRSTASG